MRITGQQIHEAYLHTVGGNGQAWKSMSEGLKARYGCMAERLNPSWEHTVVCLCGSTRFMQAFQDANLRETLAGNIVLSIGCDTKDDSMLHLGPEVKEQLVVNKVTCDQVLRRRVINRHEERSDQPVL